MNGGYPMCANRYVIKKLIPRLFGKEINIFNKLYLIYLNKLINYIFVYCNCVKKNCNIGNNINNNKCNTKKEKFLYQ